MANPSVLQEQLEILAGTRRQGNQGKAAVRYEDFNAQMGTKTNQTDFETYQASVTQSLADQSTALTDAQTALQADIDGLSGTKSNVTRTINAYTGTTHTLSLVDAGNVVWMTNVGAKTLTVPPNASVAFPTGTQIDNFCSGGKLTFVPGSGVTIFSYNSKFGLESFRFATLLKIDTNVWALDGALVT
jgi:hypothetical protein